jgi:hypothetical protein
MYVNCTTDRTPDDVEADGMKIDLTREEFLALKRRLAEMRGYVASEPAQSAAA